MLGSTSRKVLLLFMVLYVGLFMVVGCDPDPTTHTLTMQVIGQGTVDPNEGSHSYEAGTVVDLTAIPADGYEFKEWVGDVANAESANTTVVMDKNKIVQAVFRREGASDNGSHETDQMIEIQEEAVDVLRDLLEDPIADPLNAIEELADWLLVQEDVQEISRDSLGDYRTTFTIKYTNGFTGMLSITLEENFEDYSLDPLKGVVSPLTLDLSLEVMEGKRVLIWSPLSSWVFHFCAGKQANILLEWSELDFDIDFYQNRDATISILTNLFDYDLIILGATHAGWGYLVSGDRQILDEWSSYSKFRIGKPSLWPYTHVTLRYFGWELISRTDIAFNPHFLDEIISGSGFTGDTIVMNAGCKGGVDLGGAEGLSWERWFLEKGGNGIAYYGYDQDVSFTFAQHCVRTALTGLLEGKTTRESYVEEVDWLPSWLGGQRATWRMYGATDIRLITDNDNDYILYGDYGVTLKRYEDQSDWDQIVADLFGPEYKVADWYDLVNFYDDGGDLLDLYDGLGLTEHGDSAYVTRNGTRNFSSTRYYFASRHEHDKPGHYMAHDHIDNYLISLGSWYGSNTIMVKRIE